MLNAKYMNVFYGNQPISIQRIILIFVIDQSIKTFTQLEIWILKQNHLFWDHIGQKLELWDRVCVNLRQIVGTMEQLGLFC